MTLEEIEGILAEALAMRSPVKDPDASSRAHIEALEDYMLRSAQIGGSLVEARHWLRILEQRLADDWAGLEGWEVALRTARNRATQQEVQQAKMKVAPSKHEALRKARLLRASVDDQIARIEREEKVVSRAYTMLSGG